MDNHVRVEELVAIMIQILVWNVLLLILRLLALMSALIQAKKKEDAIVHDIYKRELVAITIQIHVWSGLLGKQFKTVALQVGHQNIDVQVIGYKENI